MMGVVNVFFAEDMVCPRCGQNGGFSFQFKWGVLDFLAYHQGDQIVWETSKRAWLIRDPRPSHGNALIAAYVYEPCDRCPPATDDKDDGDYFMEVREDRVVSAYPRVPVEKGKELFREIVSEKLVFVFPEVLNTVRAIAALTRVCLGLMESYLEWIRDRGFPYRAIVIRALGVMLADWKDFQAEKRSGAAERLHKGRSMFSASVECVSPARIREAIESIRSDASDPLSGEAAEIMEMLARAPK